MADCLALCRVDGEIRRCVLPAHDARMFAHTDGEFGRMVIWTDNGWTECPRPLAVVRLADGTLVPGAEPGA